MDIDFRVINHGSVWSVVPLNEPTVEWMNEYVQGQHCLNIPTTGDWRMMRDIVDGMTDAGLVGEAA